MDNSKERAQKIWLVCVCGLTIFIVASIYRAFFPPLPAYIKPPPGSSVLMSRRFKTFGGGPKYYCRIYSPLPFQETAQYIYPMPYAYPITSPSRLDESQDSHSTMNNRALQRTGGFLRVPYHPEEISSEGTEVHSEMRVWPEPNGSIIEFYIETGF